MNAQHTNNMLVTLVLLALVPVTQAQAGRMSDAVAAHARSGKPDMVDVIVTYKAKPGQAEDKRAKGLGGQVYRGFERLPMRAMRVPEHALTALSNGSGVQFVSRDAEVSGTLNSARATAGEPTIDSYNSSYRGTGVRIAVIDSGVAKHTDLSNVRQYSFLDGASPTQVLVDAEIDSYQEAPLSDAFGHGTHVAGILAGDGTSNTEEYGLAHDASLFSLQVLNDQGSGTVSDTLAALDWLLQYGDAMNIRVVNMSLGKALEESIHDDPLVLAVDAVWDAGMVVVVAAGNYGQYGYMTIGSPANSRKAITIGSLTDSQTGGDFSDDYLSTYSSRGPTLIDHVLKPDLIAPGNRVVSTISAGATLGELLGVKLGLMAACGGSDSKWTLSDSSLSLSLHSTADYCSANYLELSGTSMAAPMVAATAAMMLDKDSSLSPDTIKARLMRSARKIAGDPVATGTGVLDVEAALNESGHMHTSALSPLLALSDEDGVVIIEDTGELWGDLQWSAEELWADGYLWARGFTEAAGYLWSDGYLWSRGYLWARSEMWADGYLWSRTEMWADGYLWSRVVGDPGTDGNSVLNHD
jgi:serine protease AprX